MVIKSVIVIAIAAICILAAAFAVLRYKNPIEEGFLPVYISPKTIQTVLLPQSDVKFVDESMILYSRGDKQLALTAVEYDTYLRVLDISRDTSR
jgi:3-isopropylmalate dehydratase small subunit